MCRGLGHGQPRFSSRLESLAEELKMTDGLPLELLHDCLISEKDHLHFASKNLPDRSSKKILVDWPNWAKVFVSSYKCHRFNQTHSHLQHRSDLWKTKSALNLKTCIFVSESLLCVLNNHRWQESIYRLVYVWCESWESSVFFSFPL